MPLTPTQALNRLRAHPTSFLRKHPLAIYGNATTASGVRTLYLMDGSFMDAGGHQRPGKILGRRNMHAVAQTFTVALQNLGEPNTHQFQAEWLKMSPWQGPSDINNISMVNLGPTGPDVMFTAALTGCSVGIVDRGHGAITIAHIQPNSNLPNTPQQMTLDGQGLYDTLKRSGWTKVYGRGDYGHNEHIAVVAVRKGTRWKVYAQKQSGISGFGSIRSVKTIYG